ncbi:unnamed protein product [Toxocara canis]|uniref:DYW_deaminase domain-containing protein n=1 Tax=Toxocara canis TaxID=6265 RepID=A0A183UTX8_TOXCA|nr:unnamed protein product [Toxocara canis]
MENYKVIDKLSGMHEKLGRIVSTDRITELNDLLKISYNCERVGWKRFISLVGEMLGSEDAAVATDDEERRQLAPILVMGPVRA